MKRAFSFTIGFLLAPALFGTAASEEPVQNKLPEPSSFVAAGPHCKHRVAVSPGVGTPAAQTEGWFRCVLVYHDCKGSHVVESSDREGGDGMCDDYWEVHFAIGAREVCCDREKRAKKTKAD